jgi:hypothetical protein
MQFDRDRFAEVLGTSFVLKAADGKTVMIELVEVSEVKERPHQLSFAIVFLTPESSIVDQGLYDLDHETLGPMQLFLVPIGITDGRMMLESVFNFLREDQGTVSG